MSTRQTYLRFTPRPKARKKTAERYTSFVAWPHGAGVGAKDTGESLDADPSVQTAMHGVTTSLTPCV